MARDSLPRDVFRQLFKGRRVLQPQIITLRISLSLTPSHTASAHLHGDDASWNEFFEMSNGEVPALDAHQIVESGLQDESSFRHNLTHTRTQNVRIPGNILRESLAHVPMRTWAFRAA